MRILEIILLIVLTVCPFYLSMKKYSIEKIKLLLGIGILVLMHVLIDGLRWQMTPIYVLIIILCWCIYKEFKFFKGGWFRKIVSGLGLLILLFMGWLLSNIFPVFKLPQPSGEYIVGSQYIHLKTIQDEIITTETGDTRELMIKVWYPAKLNDEIKESYLNDGDRVGFTAKYGIPSSTFNYLDYVKTHTYVSPSMVNGKFPVLIFSHGSYSNASGYYALIEEIVSHGYIVFNINHTYESTGTLFPNGEIKFYNVKYDRKVNNQKMADMAWEASQAFQKATNFEARHKAIENTLRNYIAADITQRWAKDFSLVIDELENWNNTSFLKNHLDISKLGVLGHSQGGSAAGQSLLDDKRVKAGINLDGVQWGNMIDTLMTKPFALLSSDWAKSHPDFNAHAYHNGSTSDFFIAKILNSGHSNFMDIPLMINLKLVNEAGSIDPYLANDLTSEFVLNFFGKYLLNESVDLIGLLKKHSEIEIKFHDKSNRSLIKE